MVRPNQRYTKARPCPVCRGHKDGERGTKKRCHGFLGEGGCWCAHEKSVKKSNSSGLYWHPDPRSEVDTYNSQPITHVYEYFDEEGKYLYEVCRTTKKDFPIRRKDPKAKSGYSYGLGNAPKVLFNLPAVIRAVKQGDRIYVVEGEKDVLNLKKRGVVATTSPFGAGQWSDRYAESLRGCSEVVIVSDWDGGDVKVPYKGQKHARDVYDSLARIGIPARIVKAKTGKDASDHLNADHGVGDFVDVSIEDVRQLIEAGAEDEARENPKRSWVPFPVEVLPEIVRKIVEESAAGMSCDPAMIAAPLLAVLAACIGNARILKISTTWTAPSILWVAVIADSGTMKSPALNLVMSPLRGLDHENCKKYLEELNEYLKAKAEFTAAEKAKEGPKKMPHVPPEPINPRLVIGDSTVEAIGALLAECPRGLLLCRDELSAWIGSFNAYKGGKGGDEGSWLEFHDGRGSTIDRKQHDPIMIRRASVSVVGTIQPHVLKHVVTEAHRAGGLIPRLLVLRPPKKRKRWSEKQVPQETVGELTALYERLQSLKFAESGGPVTLTFSGEAHQVWVEFFNQLADRQFFAEGHEASTLAKLEEKVARIALVIELCMTADPWQLALVSEVTEAALEAAIKIVEWFENEAYRLADLLDSSKQEGQLERLLEWIVRKDAEGATVRDISRNIRSYQGDGELIERDLVVLVDRKLVRKIEGFVRARGGPKHTRYWAAGVASADGDASTPNGPEGSDCAPSPPVGDGVTDASTEKPKDDRSAEPDGPGGSSQGLGSGGSVDTDSGSIGEVGDCKEVGGVSVSARSIESCGLGPLRGESSPHHESSTASSGVDGTPDSGARSESPPKTNANPQCGVDASPSVDGTLPGSEVPDSRHDERCVDASVTPGDPTDEFLVAWAEGAGSGAVPSRPTLVRKRSIQDPTKLLEGIAARFHLSGALTQLERADVLALWRDYGQKPDVPAPERSAPDDLDEWGTV